MCCDVWQMIRPIHSFGFMWFILEVIAMGIRGFDWIHQFRVKQIIFPSNVYRANPIELRVSINFRIHQNNAVIDRRQSPKSNRKIQTKVNHSNNIFACELFRDIKRCSTKHQSMKIDVPMLNEMEDAVRAIGMHDHQSGMSLIFDCLESIFCVDYLINAICLNLVRSEIRFGNGVNVCVLVDEMKFEWQLPVMQTVQRNFVKNKRTNRNGSRNLLFKRNDNNNILKIIQIEWN